MTTRPGPTRVTVLRCTGCRYLLTETLPGGALHGYCHHDVPSYVGLLTNDTPDWCPLPAPPDPRDALLTEVAGTWTAFEHALREAIGNTNYNVIAERIEAAIGDKEESRNG